MADVEALDADGSDGDADEFQHLAVERLHHAADLAVAAFGDGDLEEVSCSSESRTRLTRAGRVGPSLSSRPERSCSNCSSVRRVDGFDEVGLGHVEFGIGDVLGEVGVVGEDEEAGGVLVEAADGEDPLIEPWRRS